MLYRACISLSHVNRFEELVLPHLDAAHNLARWPPLTRIICPLTEASWRPTRKATTPTMVTYFDRRTRNENQRVLHVGVPDLRTQAPVHDGYGAACASTGARGRPRCHAKATGSQARSDESSQTQRRTHLWTLNHWMGSAHFLTKTLAKVRTEMSLQVLAYNLKRVMQIIGIAGTIRAIRTAGA